MNASSAIFRRKTKKEPSKRQPGLEFLLRYSILFVIAACLVFGVFLAEHKSLVWNSDASGQYAPNLSFLYSNILQFVSDLLHRSPTDAFPGFSFSAGVGMDVSNLYFKGVLEYLFVVLLRKNLELSYSLIILVRLYLAGLSFGALGLYWKQKPEHVCIGALVYVFNGYTLLYGLRHSVFLIPFVCFPMLLLGIEKLLRKEKPWIFILFIFYSAWTEYYFLYISTLGLGFYVLARWMDGQKKWREILRDFGMIVVTWLLGVAMAAVSIAVKLGRYFESARSGSVTIESESLLVYGGKWLPKFLVRLFSPYFAPDYTKYYMLYAVSALLIPCTVGLFLQKDRKYRKLKRLLVLCFVIFMIPAAAFVFSGFNSIVNRWSYMFALLAGMIVTCALSDLKRLLSRNICLGTAIYGAVMLLMVLLDPELRNVSTVLGLSYPVIFILLLLGGEYFGKRLPILKGKDISYGLIVFFVLLNLSVNGIYYYSSRFTGFSAEFVDRGELLARYENTDMESARAITDKSFYRVEAGSVYQNMANVPKVYGINGTAHYDTVPLETAVRFSDVLRNNSQLTIGNFYGYDSRSILEKLAAVKYYITSVRDEGVPHGFRLYKDTVNIQGQPKFIYRNYEPISLGFTMDQYFSEEEAESLEALEIQDVLSQALILSEEDINRLFGEEDEGRSLRKYQYEDHVFPLPYTWKCTDGVTMEDGDIIVENKDGRLILSCSVPANSELYLKLSGMNMDEVSGTSMGMYVATEHTNTLVWLKHSQDKYRNEHYQDYLIRVGGASRKRQTVDITLSFLKTGVYHLDEMQLMAEQMREFASGALLRDVEVKRDHISAAVDASGDSFLFLSIPYTAGWKARVDGVDTEIIKADYMWMMLPVTEGTHEIVLEYSNKYLKAGAVLSAGFIALFVLLVILSRIRSAKLNKGLEQASSGMEQVQ